MFCRLICILKVETLCVQDSYITASNCKEKDVEDPVSSRSYAIGGIYRVNIKQGKVVSMRLCVGSRVPMEEVAQAVVLAGKGIEGDRHNLNEDGTKSKRQILLMDRETLSRFQLDDGVIRENITVEGLELSSLTDGDRVSVGSEVVLQITGECEPCSRMDEIRQGLQVELKGQRGMLAYAESGGTISVGDSITVSVGDSITVI